MTSTSDRPIMYHGTVAFDGFRIEDTGCSLFLFSCLIVDPLTRSDTAATVRVGSRTETRMCWERRYCGMMLLYRSVPRLIDTRLHLHYLAFRCSLHPEGRGDGSCSRRGYYNKSIRYSSGAVERFIDRVTDLPGQQCMQWVRERASAPMGMKIHVSWWAGRFPGRSPVVRQERPEGCRDDRRKLASQHIVVG